MVVAFGLLPTDAVTPYFRLAMVMIVAWSH
jgi:hypothetical protein